GRFLDGAVHTLDLAIGPRMIGFGEPVFDAVLAADAIEHVRTVARGWAIAVPRCMAELDAVVGQHGVDVVGHGLDQRFEECGCSVVVRHLLEADEVVLAGEVGCHEAAMPFFGRWHVSNVAKEAALGALLLLLRAFESGHGLMPWWARQRCRLDLVRCGMLGWR